MLAEKHRKIPSLVPDTPNFLRRTFEVVNTTANTMELRSVIPVTGLPTPSTLSVSVRDDAGLLCGDQLVLQD